VSHSPIASTISGAALPSSTRHRSADNHSIRMTQDDDLQRLCSGAWRLHTNTNLSVTDTSQLLLLIPNIHSSGTSGWPVGTPQPITNGKPLTIVVHVVRVMHCVILGAHQEAIHHIPIQSIVNVGSPDGCKEEKQQVGDVVDRYHQCHQHVGACLQDSVQRVKGD